MVKIVKHISVDVAAQNVFQSIIAKQYDNDSRFLTVRLTNEGKPINVKESSQVLINARREDNEATAFTGTVNEDGTITVPITYWMLELDGQVECDISVINSERRKLSSTTFTINVEAATYDGEDISEDENYDIMVELAAACSEATTACSEATELAKKVSYNAANALKGSVKGNPIVITDVSPLAHEMAVKLTEKTYTRGEAIADEAFCMDMSWIADYTKDTFVTITLVGSDYLEFSDGSYCVGESGQLSSDIDGVLEDFFTLGEVVCFSRIDGSRWLCKAIESGEVPCTGKKVYEVGDLVTDLSENMIDFNLNTSIDFGDAFPTVTEIDADTDTIYFDDGSYWQGDGNLHESFEVGEVVCFGFYGFEECVSISRATVTEVPATLQRYGKNLLPKNRFYHFPDKKDNYYELYNMPHGTYTLSGWITKYPDDTSTATRLKIVIYYKDGTTNMLFVGMDSNNAESDGVPRYKSGSITTDATKEIKKIEVSLDYSALNNPNRIAENVMLEFGSTATAFEPYVEPTTYTAENGIVNGIIGNGEGMTLIADSGVIVTAEYNKDTNKVIESLVNAIISLGGNV